MKSIAVEITRIFTLEVEDSVDPSDWLKLGMLVADRSERAEVVDILGWAIPHGDLHSQASVANREEAQKRRLADAIAMLDAHMTIGGAANAR